MTLRMITKMLLSKMSIMMWIHGKIRHWISMAIVYFILIGNLISPMDIKLVK